MQEIVDEVREQLKEWRSNKLDQYLEEVEDGLVIMAPPEDVAEKAIWKAVAKREQAKQGGMGGLGEMLEMVSKMEEQGEQGEQETEEEEENLEVEQVEQEPQEEHTEESSEEDEDQAEEESEEVLPELESLGQTKRERLSEAGLNSGNIEDASKEHLEAIDGIGPATIEDIEDDLGIEFSDENEDDQEVEVSENGQNSSNDLTSSTELTEEEAEEISTFV